MFHCHVAFPEWSGEPFGRVWKQATPLDLPNLPVKNLIFPVKTQPFCGLSHFQTHPNIMIYDLRLFIAYFWSHEYFMHTPEKSPSNGWLEIPPCRWNSQLAAGWRRGDLQETLVWNLQHALCRVSQVLFVAYIGYIWLYHSYIPT